MKQATRRKANRPEARRSSMTIDVTPRCRLLQLHVHETLLFIWSSAASARLRLSPAAHWCNLACSISSLLRVIRLSAPSESSLCCDKASRALHCPRASCLRQRTHRRDRRHSDLSAVFDGQRRGRLWQQRGRQRRWDGIEQRQRARDIERTGVCCVWSQRSAVLGARCQRSTDLPSALVGAAVVLTIRRAVYSSTPATIERPCRACRSRRRRMRSVTRTPCRRRLRPQRFHRCLPQRPKLRRLRRSRLVSMRWLNRRRAPAQAMDAATALAVRCAALAVPPSPIAIACPRDRMQPRRSLASSSTRTIRRCLRTPMASERCSARTVERGRRRSGDVTATAESPATPVVGRGSE